MVLPIPHSSPEEHVRIADVTGCVAYLVPDSEKEAFNARLAPHLPDLPIVLVPCINAMLEMGDKDSEDETLPAGGAIDDPWLVFHGISSTGRY